MRFLDREQEFEKLREIEEVSQEVAQFTIITRRPHLYTFLRLRSRR